MILGALGLGLLILGWPGGVVGTADVTTVPFNVSQEFLTRGGGRVLVRLRLPAGRHIPEGFLATPAGVTRQRAEIGVAQSRLITRLQGKAHRVLRHYQTVPLLALEVGPDGLSELAASSSLVESVTEDRPRSLIETNGVALIGADQAWPNGFDGTGTVIAIIDTGVDGTHPVLQGKVIEEACFSTTSTTNTSGPSLSVCPNGTDLDGNGSFEQIGPGAAVPCDFGACWHGTHVAGIAAGNFDGADVPAAGVAKGAGLIAVQVFSEFTNCGPCPRAYDADILKGLEFVLGLSDTYTIAAVNMSLGGPVFSSPSDCDTSEKPYKDIIDNLRAAGIATVIASGNDHQTSAISSPACVSSAVSVASTGPTDAVSDFSNVAPFLALFAPGENITSSVPTAFFLTGFTSASGTSMATPHVAGTWSILRQVAPDATVDQILAALQSTGVPVTDTRAGTPPVKTTKPRIRVLQALTVLGAPDVTLQLVTGGLAKPVAITHASDGSGRLFLTEQCGKIKIFDGTSHSLLATPFLDLSASVSCDVEQGLLSVAFHPSYVSNGFFYVYFTNLAGKAVIKRFSVSSDNPDVADPASGRLLLKIPHPGQTNHYGGQLQFGPDGYLYVSVGDGGGVGDPGNNAQNLGVLLGKLLRLDVAVAEPPFYAIPPTNPFVVTPTPGALGEIWAFGLRNPWRFSFDRQTGDLYIGDVGQDEREEIDAQPAGSPGGENYGWRLMEGMACFNPAAGCTDGSLTLPVLQYGHDSGKCAVTGGYRYRGAAVPQLAGQYVFADYCKGKIFVARPGSPWAKTKLLGAPYNISAFGEDPAGELYVADRAGGAVYRIVPVTP